MREIDHPKLRPQSLTSLDYYLLKESETEVMEHNLTIGTFSVFKWTVLLPSLVIGGLYGAFKLRSTYSQLAVPAF